MFDIIFDDKKSTEVTNVGEQIMRELIDELITSEVQMATTHQYKGIKTLKEIDDKIDFKSLYT